MPPRRTAAPASLLPLLLLAAAQAAHDGEVAEVALALAKIKPCAGTAA